MSYSIDVNLLLYASDQDSPHFLVAGSFLKSLTEKTETCCLTWLTVMSYLRMSTHPRIFTRPLSPLQARQNIERLLALRHTRLIGETDDFWKAYHSLTQALIVRGNDVPDAHLAALLVEHEVDTLYTADRDFLKFRGFKVINPLELQG